ncbi:sigma-70 family RNA polymerase sigma factor [Balneolaceae bacterium YR4-1]|uniref:Sigma-70 family RNA polymerase sigma factor n=1 Tax=Halalkalibaculum roseum TaxID=2709311 RepID=A0A6M1T5U3_9BACT|nr:sigma-70 family RNA polymerase sigma factor [Halalkalibaculum roseum]NGP77355.1 sigma-70 family RNA polymerase sigma factor [Halalkalibaculum roseum]
MSSNTNNDYWNKFVAGDTHLFKKIFTKYYPKLYGYGIKISNNPRIVEDCIQELFENIWDRREDLHHVESPHVYLFVSLRRKVLKQISKKKNRSKKLRLLRHKPKIKFCKQDIIIKNEQINQQKEELAQALNQLPERQKEILFLHFYNGLSYSEIANVLDIKRQSIRNHVYRAMKKLRLFLTEKASRNIISLLFIFSNIIFAT